MMFLSISRATLFNTCTDKLSKLKFLSKQVEHVDYITIIIIVINFSTYQKIFTAANLADDAEK